SPPRTLRSFLVPAMLSPPPRLAALVFLIVGLSAYGPPMSNLFPYTTLFRSRHERRILIRQSRLRHRNRAVTAMVVQEPGEGLLRDRKSTRLNSSHRTNSYAVFCLKKKKAHHADGGPRGPDRGRQDRPASADV